MLHLGIAPLQPSKILRDWYSLRGLFFHLETAAKLLKLLERVLAVFSKCTLKLLDNQADFDSAIPRFESWRPSRSPHRLRALYERLAARRGCRRDMGAQVLGDLDRERADSPGATRDEYALAGAQVQLVAQCL
jgi:hypothetical protein